MCSQAARVTRKTVNLTKTRAVPFCCAQMCVSILTWSLIHSQAQLEEPVQMHPFKRIFLPPPTLHADLAVEPNS